MLVNAFVGKPEQPTDDDLKAALGFRKPLWDQLLADLADEHQLVIREWNSYSPKAGWSLRLKLRQRNILYLSPTRSSFTATVVLGDKAVQAARQGRLPRRVIRIIDEAKRYPEGTAVRIEVEKPSDLAVVKKLAKIKLEH